MPKNPEQFVADAPLEGDGFELPVPLTEARDILVLMTIHWRETDSNYWSRHGETLFGRDM
jgi:hypothetical protein